MIQNDTEQRITNRELDNLRSGLDAARSRRNPSEHEWIRELEIDAIGSEIRRLEKQLSEYEARADAPQQLKLVADLGVWEERLWDAMPFKEIAALRWFDLTARKDPERWVKKYFHNTMGLPHAVALHRKQKYRGRQPNPYALLAWQAQVLEQAKKKEQRTDLRDFDRDRRALFKELATLTQEEDGPRRSVDLLARNGIVLVTVEHLKGTYLDGAAMLDADGRPVVGLTLRRNRLDNFWFVLFHELAHVYLHLGEGSEDSFFDNDESELGDRLEKEANRFALDQLISPADWDQCLSRFATTEETVRTDAERLGVGPSILAGRIRRELRDYTLLTGLLGEGRVQCQFSDEDAW